MEPDEITKEELRQRNLDNSGYVEEEPLEQMTTKKSKTTNSPSNNLDKLCLKYSEMLTKLEFLKVEKENLRKELYKQLPDSGYAANFANFGWMRKKEWEYSPRITEMEAEVEKEKEAQQKEGAKFTIKKTLIIKPY